MRSFAPAVLAALLLAGKSEAQERHPSPQPRPPAQAEPKPLSREDLELVKELALLEQLELVKNLELFQPDLDAAGKEPERQP